MGVRDMLVRFPVGANFGVETAQNDTLVLTAHRAICPFIVRPAAMTARAQDSTDNGPRVKSRVPRGPGFSGEEVKFLFKTVEALLPGSMDEWDALARAYNTRFPLATRSGESLRRKFLKLGRSDYTERARRIKVLIQKRLRKEAGFQLPEDLEEAEEVEASRAESEHQDRAGEDNSGTDSDVHAGRSDRRAEEEEEEEGEEHEGEEEEAVGVEESVQTSRRTSNASSSDQGNANATDYGDQDRQSGPDSRNVVADAATRTSEGINSVTSGEGRSMDRDRDPPQLATVPPSDPVVYRPPPASVSALPARSMSHYPPPSEQHQHHPEHQLSFPPQRPPHLVTVGHYQRGYRESAEVPPPSAVSTVLSSPTVVNRWFALEERRLMMEEQRMAFEQRRLAVEERRLQLLEQRMEADAAERNRLLEVLQLAMKNNSAGSRNAES